MNLSKERAKVLLLGANIVNFLIGVIILGYGVWLVIFLQTHPYGTSGFPTQLAGLFIAIGCITTILALIIGFKAHTKPSMKLTNFYYFLMFVLLVSQIAIVSLNYRWKPTAKCAIKEALFTYLDTYDKTDSVVWDEFQKKKKCCGVKGEFQIDDRMVQTFLKETQKAWNRTNDLDCKDYSEGKKYDKYCTWNTKKDAIWKETDFDGDVKYKKACTSEYKANYAAEKEGYKNWKYNATKWQESLRTYEQGKHEDYSKSVPDSCCKNYSKDCGKYSTRTKGDYTAWLKKTINKKGCHYKMVKDVKNDIGKGHMATIVLFIMVLVSVFFACYLLKIIDPPKH